MITPILETKRILLRPANMSDAEAIYQNWASDPAVSKYVDWDVHRSIEETKAWLATVEADISGEDRYEWLFVCKETNEPFGFGGVFKNDTYNMFELGYSLMQKSWGRGLAAEAARRMLDFAIHEIGASRFFAYHAEENPASGRVLEKLGFVYKKDGTFSSFNGEQIFRSREYFLDI